MGRKVGYAPGSTGARPAHTRGVGMLDVRRKAAHAAAQRSVDFERRTAHGARGSHSARSAHELVDDRLSLPVPAAAAAAAAPATDEIFSRLAPGQWSNDSPHSAHLSAPCALHRMRCNRTLAIWYWPSEALGVYVGRCTAAMHATQSRLRTEAH
jgi:hypothetical protein